MEKYVEKIQRQYTKDLLEPALDYLKIGLELFHQRKHLNLNFQVVMGNLSIAIELMLKAFLSSKNLSLLFKDIPLELKILFTCVKDIPNTFNWRKHDIELRSGTYKAIGFNDCISCFYTFFPDIKQSLHSHLKFLSKYRNTSVHFVFPSFQKYEIERVVFVALKVFLTIKQTEVYKFGYYQLNDDDEKFLKQFDEKRIERVKKKIEEAKIKARKISHKESSISIEGWESYVTDCPLCGSDAILEGYTEEHTEEAEDGYPEPCLKFFAYTFKCEECGLSLDDSEELSLAGKDIVYDRSDELSKWFSEIDRELVEEEEMKDYI
jgi:hypothetical protein